MIIHEQPDNWDDEYDEANPAAANIVTDRDYDPNTVTNENNDANIVENYDLNTVTDENNDANIVTDENNDRNTVTNQNNDANIAENYDVNIVTSVNNYLNIFTDANYDLDIAADGNNNTDIFTDAGTGADLLPIPEPLITGRFYLLLIITLALIIFINYSTSNQLLTTFTDI